MIVNSGNLTTLYTAFNAAFMEGFGQAAADEKPIVMETSSMTGEEEYGWLGHFPKLREWVGDRVYRGIAEHGYTIHNRTFESTVEVRRESIEDDKYGVYSPIFSEAGLSAGAHPTELAYGALRAGFATPCYDGQYFFDTDHPVGDGVRSNVVGAAVANAEPWFLVDASRMIKPIVFQRRRAYNLQALDDLNDEHVFKKNTFLFGVDGRCNVGYGLWQLAVASTQPLTSENYEAARKLLQSVKSDEGRPLGIKPTHLVASTNLEKDVLELLNAERLANGATNVWRGTCQSITTPWLT